MDKEPYGSVSYADPGYQKDGQKRYPIDTAAHVRAAWSYINQADNRRFYSAEQLASIEGRIKAAAKRFGIEIADSGKTEALMITQGPAVKAMGDGKISGYLVTWGDEATKDAEGEWFTADTDFGIPQWPARTSVHYHHGMDPVFGRKRLTWGTMTMDEFGILIEAQLNLRDPAQKSIYRKVENRELGWSSGSVSHLTIPPRDNPGGWVSQWALGNDASLTPIPSDRRNVAFATKSAPLPPVEVPLREEGWSSSLAENTDRWMDDGMYVLSGYQGIASKAGRKLSAARRERLMQMAQMIADMLAETEPREAAAVETSASPPGTGEGAEAATAARGLDMPTPNLPDLHDLYLAAITQYDGAATVPMGG